MHDLHRKALEKIGKGASSKKKEEASDVAPFKDAMREAFEASKAGDFDAFASAFESALNIKLADHSMKSRDPGDDEAEDYEFDELEQ